MKRKKARIIVDDGGGTLDVYKGPSLKEILRLIDRKYHGR